MRRVFPEVAKATREFVKGLDRKQRFDMNENGLEIMAESTGTATGKEIRGSRSAEARGIRQKGTNHTWREP